MAHYLVTGGCGFIGSHLSEALLAAGNRVRILDDLSTGKHANKADAAELIEGDIADPACVARALAETDGCFHLAAIASVEKGNRDWLGTHRSNLTGSITVFDAARSARGGQPVPVIYASSAAVYGDNPQVPLTEDSATRPLSAYGADKLGCELHARVASHVHGVPTVGLRFFNVFGPRQDPTSPYSGVISIFVDRLKADRPLAIYGDGKQTRDFVYVGDVVSALLAAMRVLPAGSPVFNICTGRATSVLDIAHLIAGLCGVTASVDFQPPRAGEARVSFGDPARAAAVLGTRATTELHDGLARMLGAAG
ncbi:MAG TPA: NAD-dependent epimerase/dehydratase family protein [Stellaceae bacterium]|nr:NAD-dependent epimerase/dehydratase family protein [Stellaceae bacterium]